ncbi:hypothetical protein BC628DRAFT_1410425 [Trametes gibbosa]|nr:hypothetical protein BC628DRAFT_1410425 [Trametes gibbosa]
MAASGDTFRKFDDTDPSLVYTGDWFDNPGIHGAFNNTLSSTTHEGDTVHIEFVASQIVVIGATVAPASASSNSGPISGYTLDNATNSLFLFQAGAANATSITFYNSGLLTFGKHTLDISVVRIQDDIPYLLDAIYIQTPSSTQSSTSTAIWVSTVFVTPSAIATGLADQNNGTQATSTNSTPVGPIVGGVVGGVALLVAAALVIYFCFFRNRRHGVYAYHGFGDAPPLDNEKDDVVGGFSQPPPMDPYVAPARTPARGSSYTDSLAFASPVGGAPVLSGSPPADLSHTYPPAGPVSLVASGSSGGSGRNLSVVNDAPASGVYLAPAQRKTAEARRTREELRNVQYHADSGARFDSEGRPIGSSSSDPLPLADVPPQYTPS